MHVFHETLNIPQKQIYIYILYIGFGVSLTQRAAVDIGGPMSFSALLVHKEYIIYISKLSSLEKAEKKY